MRCGYRPFLVDRLSVQTVHPESISRNIRGITKSKRGHRGRLVTKRSTNGRRAISIIFSLIKCRCGSMRVRAVACPDCGHGADRFEVDVHNKRRGRPPGSGAADRSTARVRPASLAEPATIVDDLPARYKHMALLVRCASRPDRRTLAELMGLLGHTTPAPPCTTRTRQPTVTRGSQSDSRRSSSRRRPMAADGRALA